MRLVDIPMDGDEVVMIVGETERPEEVGVSTGASLNPESVDS